MDKQNSIDVVKGREAVAVIGIRRISKAEYVDVGPMQTKDGGGEILGDVSSEQGFGEEEENGLEERREEAV